MKYLVFGYAEGKIDSFLGTADEVMLGNNYEWASFEEKDIKFPRIFMDGGTYPSVICYSKRNNRPVAVYVEIGAQPIGLSISSSVRLAE